MDNTTEENHGAEAHRLPQGCEHLRRIVADLRRLAIAKRGVSASILRSSWNFGSITNPAEMQLATEGDEAEYLQNVEVYWNAYVGDETEGFNTVIDVESIKTDDGAEYDAEDAEIKAIYTELREVIENNKPSKR
jgi:hypothetical protein